MSADGGQRTACHCTWRQTQVDVLIDLLSLQQAVQGRIAITLEQANAALGLPRNQDPNSAKVRESIACAWAHVRDPVRYAFLVV